MPLTAGALALALTLYIAPEVQPDPRLDREGGSNLEERWPHTTFGCLGLILFLLFGLSHSRFVIVLRLEAIGSLRAGGVSFTGRCRRPLGLGCGAMPSPRTSLAQWVSRWQRRLERDRDVLILGLVLLVAPLGLYLAFGRVLGPGTDSRHTAILQPGLCLCLGVVGWRLACATASRRPRLAAAAVAGTFALGVAVLNMNTAVYAACTAHEREFLRAFAERFPSLPPQRLFLVDSGQSSGVEWPQPVDLETSFDLEYGLGLLYAPSLASDEFRVARVLPLGEWKIIHGASDRPFKRSTYWERGVVDPRQAIVVAYRDGRVLVDREILAVDPNVPYRTLADKPPPVLPPPPPSGYPLRDRIFK